MTIIFVFFGLLDYQEPNSYFLNPVMSAYGIVVTDNQCSAIYLIKENKISELISSPGCGSYYTISPDKNLIGLKLITEHGLQTPAIYDLTSHQITRLYKPVYQAGQISFSNNNKIAFAIDEELIVKNGNDLERYYLGVYANLAPISPNGNFVAYNDNFDQLRLINLTTKEKLCFTDSKYGYFYPKWSPDSRFLAYSTLGGTIKVYDLFNKNTCEIDQGMNPEWSPDSKYLSYYVIETDGHSLTGSDLYVSKYDGKEKIRLTNTPEIFEMDPKFCYKGQIIFHTYDKREICIARLCLVESKIENNVLQEIETVHNESEPFKINHYKVTSDFGTRDSIDVPYLHQVYDTPDWFDGSWACAPTTAMMAIAYYRKLPHWDCWCSWPYGHTSHFGRYISELYHYREVTYSDTARDPDNNLAWGGYGYMWYNGYSPYSRMVYYINYHDITSWTDNSPTWDETIAEISAGYPYCMCVGLTVSGHLVLAVGQVLDWHTLIFNDPYGNKNLGYMNYNGKYARYDWPGYNNGYENLNLVYWCRGAQGNWEPPADTIVDDLQFRYADLGEQFGFYLYTDSPASMRFWRDALTGYEGHMWWTYATNSADTCYATWTPNLTLAGDYEVFTYIPSVNSNALARYKIYYSGGNQTVIINQANYQDQWVSLGTYPFDISGGYSYLGDATGTPGQLIGYDAMKWSFKGPGIKEYISANKNTASIKSNPTRGNVTLNIHLGVSQKVTISIYEITGRCVHKEDKGQLNKDFNIIQINTSHLPTGVYILKVSIGNEDIFNKCVIIH